MSQVDSVDARYGRAQAAFATGLYEIALEDIDEVLVEMPLDQGALLLRGKTLVELERYDEGLTDLNQVLVQGVEDMLSNASEHNTPAPTSRCGLY